MAIKPDKVQNMITSEELANRNISDTNSHTVHEHKTDCVALGGCGLPKINFGILKSLLSKSVEFHSHIPLSNKKDLSS